MKIDFIFMLFINVVLVFSILFGNGRSLVNMVFLRLDLDIKCKFCV